MRKLPAFFIGAICPNKNRFAEIQAEHTHKAFGIDQGAAVAGYHPKGLDRGDFHKILDLREGTQNNVELLQGFSLPVLYKWRNFMYNETASKIIIKHTPMLPIIPRFCNFSIDALDEIYKSVYSNLVKIT